MIGTDTSTKDYIFSEDYDSTLAVMNEDTWTRLKEKKLAMYDELKDIISDEFDLHKDLTKNIITQDEFEKRVFNGQ